MYQHPFRDTRLLIDTLRFLCAGSCKHRNGSEDPEIPCQSADCHRQVYEIIQAVCELQDDDKISIPFTLTYYNRERASGRTLRNMPSQYKQ